MSKIIKHDQVAQKLGSPTKNKTLKSKLSKDKTDPKNKKNSTTASTASKGSKELKHPEKSEKESGKSCKAPAMKDAELNEMETEQIPQKRKYEDLTPNTSTIAKKERLTDEPKDSVLTVEDSPTAEKGPNFEKIPAYIQEHLKIIRKAIKDNEEAEDSLDALASVLYQFQGRIHHLSGKLEERRGMTTVSSSSYAAAAAAIPPQKLSAPKLLKQAAIRPPQNVVFVKSKTADETTDETKLNMMKCFNPQREKVQIKNIRKTRNGLLIETTTQEGLKILENHTALNEKFNIQRPKKRNPRIIIYDVPKDLTEEQLTEAVLSQNPDVKKTDCNEIFMPRFRTGKRKTETVNWVVEVSPEIRNGLLKLGRVYVGCLACKVQDFILVTRCFKCQGFGHISKHCEKELFCSSCAESGHKHDDCPNKEKPKKCINCNRRNIDHNHDVTDKKCSTYKIALERTINSTNYGP